MSCARRTAPFPAALAAAALGAIGGADANNLPSDGGHGPPFIAIWRVQRFEFTYHSTNVYYSCRALQRKLGSILHALGAHRHIMIDIECGGDEMVNHAFARIALAVPTEASPENIRAATTYDERTKLAAKVRRIQLPTADDLIRFPAQRRTISLTRHRDVKLEPGDCDLLRDLRSQVFPKLDIHEEGNGLVCTPGAARLRPQMKVSALVPVQADVPRRRASG